MCNWAWHARVPESARARAFTGGTERWRWQGRRFAYQTDTYYSSMMKKSSIPLMGLCVYNSVLNYKKTLGTIAKPLFFSNKKKTGRRFLETKKSCVWKIISVKWWNPWKKAARCLTLVRRCQWMSASSRRCWVASSQTAAGHISGPAPTSSFHSC